jgi:hypothetical protein
VTGWTREAIAARVEAIAAEVEGPAFVEAVRSFADAALDARERELLGEVLLERAAADPGLSDAFAEIDEERRRPLLLPRPRRRPRGLPD